MKKLLFPLFVVAFLASCNQEPIVTRDVCMDGKVISVNLFEVSDYQAQGYAIDMDQDGFFDIENPCSDTDCDDFHFDAVSPSSAEICGNGLDDDCDGDVDEDCDCGEIPNLLLVKLANGKCIYAHPGDSSPWVLWGGIGTDIPGVPNTSTQAAAEADFGGAANTRAIVATLGTTATPAKICADLVSLGYDDWYLPAQGELKAINEQLGPAGSNGFFGNYYWSSSESNSDKAWAINFVDDTLTSDPKNLGGRCRCVRESSNFTDRR